MSAIFRLVALASVCCLAPPAAGAGTLAQDRLPQLEQAQSRPTLAPVPIHNGVLHRRSGHNALAPLKVITPDSADYLLKLVDVKSGREEMLIYVGRNSTFDTKVPLGVYSIHGAFGATWYGGRNLFGGETVYFKLMQKDGGNDQFAFSRSGGQVHGYTVRLIKQVAGNLETPAIKPEDF